LACWWGAAQWYRQRLLADERARAQAQVASIGAALTTAVDRRIQVLDGLAAFVQSEPTSAAVAARFDAFAGNLFATADGIRVLRIEMRDGSRFTYPAQPEAERDAPVDQPAGDRAFAPDGVGARTITLSGPYELHDGHLGLMARRPISVEDVDLGSVSVVLDLPALLQDARLSADAGTQAYGLQLAVQNGTDQIVYGTADTFTADPVTVSLDLPEDGWGLAGVPVGGWDAAVRRRPGLFFESAALVIVGLLAGLTYLTTNRQARLAIAVDERTAEIATINTTLERQAALLELAHDAILVRGLDGTISYWSSGAEQLYGWSREAAVGAVSHDLLKSVFPESRAVADDVLIRDGRWDGELIHTRRDGERIPVSSRQALQRDEQGRPLGVLEINIDITEQKLAGEELERRVAERTRELTALLELSGTIGSTLELRPLLGLILEQLRAVVEYSHAGVISNEDGGRHTFLEYRGPYPREQVVGRAVPPEISAMVEETLRRRAPLLVDDWQQQEGGPPIARMLTAQGVALSPQNEDSARGSLFVPLIVRGALVGSLGISYPAPGHYTERHAQLAMAFAQRVAIAIENARLYEAARERAALEERQRLARDLHDSVSQVLYAIALIASSAEEIRDIAPERLPHLHEQVLSLAEAGMAELRALIFELRPESLEREGLVAALEKQTVAIHARHGMTVRASLGEEPEVPLATKNALYRIAPEALQNAVKHARPKTIDLTLDVVAGELRLCVADDGNGFDQSSDFPGHLGLLTMRERAEGIGAVLVVESAPGRGVRVLTRLRLPVAEPVGEPVSE
jgi:PAS domain S-box-containing protein